MGYVVGGGWVDAGTCGWQRLPVSTHLCASRGQGGGGQGGEGRPTGKGQLASQGGPIPPSNALVDGLQVPRYVLGETGGEERASEVGGEVVGCAHRVGER